MERHFNVTTYVADKETKKFLMIKHKKLGKWLPPGGHINQNEIPDDAAKREVKEETGLEVELYAAKFPKEQGLARPYGIQKNVIENGVHEHLDLIYLAFISQNLDLIQNMSETSGINWFGIEEIKDDGFETFDATKQWCIYFYELMSQLDSQ